MASKRIPGILCGYSSKAHSNIETLSHGLSQLPGIINEVDSSTALEHIPDTNLKFSDPKKAKQFEKRAYEYLRNLGLLKVNLNSILDNFEKIKRHFKKTFGHEMWMYCFEVGKDASNSIVITYTMYDYWNKRQNLTKTKKGEKIIPKSSLPENFLMDPAFQDEVMPSSDGKRFLLDKKFNNATSLLQRSVFKNKTINAQNITNISLDMIINVLKPEEHLMISQGSKKPIYNKKPNTKNIILNILKKSYPKDEETIYDIEKQDFKYLIQTSPSFKSLKTIKTTGTRTDEGYSTHSPNKLIISFNISITIDVYTTATFLSGQTLRDISRGKALRAATKKGSLPINFR